VAEAPRNDNSKGSTTAHLKVRPFKSVAQSSFSAASLATEVTKTLPQALKRDSGTERRLCTSERRAPPIADTTYVKLLSRWLFAVTDLRSSAKSVVAFDFDSLCLGGENLPVLVLSFTIELA
jgi:hypothetical protein